MRRYRFDIVHSHSSKTGILARLAAKAAAVPCVAHTVHGFAFASTSSPLKRVLYFGLEWLAARYCDVMICLKPSDVSLRTVADGWVGAAEVDPQRHCRR